MLARSPTCHNKTTSQLHTAAVSRHRPCIVKGRQQRLAGCSALSSSASVAEITARIAQHFYEVQSLTRPTSSAIHDFTNFAILAYECGYSQDMLRAQLQDFVTSEGADASLKVHDCAVRRATTHDVNAMAAIDMECEKLGSAGWNTEQIQAELSKEYAHVLVAESADGHVLGFVVGWLVADEIEVVELAVQMRCQGRGIGSTLLAAILTELRCEENVSILEVRANNTTALGMYKKFGFTSIASRKGYYPDGQDAQVLTRPAGPLAS